MKDQVASFHFGGNNGRRASEGFFARTSTCTGAFGWTGTRIQPEKKDIAGRISSAGLRITGGIAVLENENSEKPCRAMLISRNREDLKMNGLSKKAAQT
jgi:hypothetical protein